MADKASITMQHTGGDDVSMLIEVPSSILWRVRGRVAAWLIVVAFRLLGGTPTIGPRHV